MEITIFMTKVIFLIQTFEPYRIYVLYVCILYVHYVSRQFDMKDSFNRRVTKLFMRSVLSQNLPFSKTDYLVTSFAYLHILLPFLLEEQSLADIKVKSLEMLSSNAEFLILYTHACETFPYRCSKRFVAHIPLAWTKTLYSLLSHPIESISKIL